MATREVSNNEIMEALNGFANDVNKRFDSVDERFDGVDKRFDSLEKRVDGIDKRLFRLEQNMTEVKADIIDVKASYNRLSNTLDKFLARIDHYETEQQARDLQFERLLAWARKVSDKTGIPLENL